MTARKILNTAPVNLRRLVANTTNDERGAIARELQNLVQSAIWTAAYVEARHGEIPGKDDFHDSAVAKANKMLSKARKLMGFHYFNDGRADCSVLRGKDVAEANARLIAAAPDLLAALKAVLSTCAYMQYSIGEDISQAAYAAIAKAEGTADEPEPSYEGLRPHNYRQLARMDKRK